MGEHVGSEPDPVRRPLYDVEVVDVHRHRDGVDELHHFGPLRTVREPRQAHVGSLKRRGQRHSGSVESSNILDSKYHMLHMLHMSARYAHAVVCNSQRKTNVTFETGRKVLPMCCLKPHIYVSLHALAITCGGLEVFDGECALCMLNYLYIIQCHAPPLPARPGPHLTYLIGELADDSRPGAVGQQGAELPRLGVCELVSQPELAGDQLPHVHQEAGVLDGAVLVPRPAQERRVLARSRGGGHSHRGGRCLVKPDGG